MPANLANIARRVVGAAATAGPIRLLLSVGIEAAVAISGSDDTDILRHLSAGPNIPTVLLSVSADNAEY